MATRRTVLATALWGGLLPTGVWSIAACSASAGPSGRSPGASHGGALRAYRDESELIGTLGRWRAQAEKHVEVRRRDQGPGLKQSAPLAMAAAPAASAEAGAAAAAPGSVGAAASESITNVQTTGVDEGGIVKQAGDFLIILRRGRLFTVRVGADALQPVVAVDAYAPDATPQGAWYDELLVSGNTVVVIGFSYARGGTEIGLFELGQDGSLAYRATYHLRSFDYYSSRNYASRLIGQRLVFYSPTLLQPWGPPPLALMPGVRRWQGQATPPQFERILPATRVYRTDDDFDPMQPLALHTVTICDLASGAMRCESTAVLGPVGRVFYVSHDSVYVWTSAHRRREGSTERGRPVGEPRSAVFRIPLDGQAPTGLKTAGVPIDALSFLADASGHLNVLLRESGGGEGMAGSDATQGAMALLRVPLSAFGDGTGAARREHYRRLPALTGGIVNNRFVGDWLLWSGTGHHFPRPGSEAPDAQAWALQYASPTAEPVTLAPGHRVERIEALGRDAVLVGGAGDDLYFSSVRLARTGVILAGRHVRAGARQGESRTHGFFYRPGGEDGGLLGLPIAEPGNVRRPGVFTGAQGAASVLFLRVQDLAFHPLGALHAQGQSVRDDACKASCVDWYGNARPIFLGGRVFGLLGYELLEGRLSGSGPEERIEERRRISFAPGARGPQGRYSPFD